MYYKLISDGEIVDIGSEVAYVRWQSKNGMWLACSESLATNIVSSDGSTMFSVDEVEVEEITAEEYEAIKTILDAGGTAEDTSKDTSPQETEEDASLEYLKSVKIAEMSAACNAIIVNGVDVVLSDGASHHFSLSVEDQLNLLSLSALVSAGQESIPYHADGEECKYYSAADFSLIANTATAWKLYHESYFNSLKIYINALEDVTVLAAIVYGAAIPEAYQSEVYQALAAQLSA